MAGITDPLTNYSFAVEIDDVAIAQFKEVNGIGITVGVIENRANNHQGLPILQKLPGTVKYEDIHLSRGKVNDKSFWDWIKKVQEGKIDEARKNGSIILYDLAHGEVSRFHFFQGWPSKVEIGKLAAGGDQVLLESVVITIEKLEVA
ncbi:MAG TPA: phage tail protein [Thermoleophilia bacterium]|jgi:phage tail-like protein|nr:phage tail protein [Thermoleophilia bacterium]